MYKKALLFTPLLLAIILYSFLHQTKIDEKVVAITQIAPHPSLDLIRKGIEDEVYGAFKKKVKIDFQSAQGNSALATQIAQNFIGKKVDVIVAITTPSAQAVLSANTLKIPLVFAGVTDPAAARLVLVDGTNKENITGVSDTPDIEKQVQLIQEFIPKGSRVGMIYNPGETNSHIHVERLTIKLKDVGYRVTVSPAFTTGDVLQATQGITPNIDALMLTNDNTVISALEAVLQTAKQKHIPIFCSDPESVKRGCKGAIAPDQYEMGRQAGKIVVRVLKGEKGHHIPVQRAPSHRFLNPNSSTI